jgi:hypothetical protein
VTVAALVAAGCTPAAREDKTTRTEPAGRQPAARDVALVRVVHAIPGGDPVDVFADDAKTFTGVQYKTVTPYRELATERYTFKLRKSGIETAEPLVQNSEGLSAGERYTILALPGDRGEAAVLRIVRDENGSEAGKTKVRVVNASPDAGTVKVMAAGKNEALFNNVGAGSVSTYDEIEPTAATLEVRAEDGRQVLARVADQPLERGKAYTILVLGRKAGTPRLEAMAVPDDPASARAAGSDHRATPAESSSR